MAEQQACTSQGGSVVSSCPTANRIGCCSVTQNGIAGNECYYFGDATSDSQACTMSGGHLVGDVIRSIPPSALVARGLARACAGPRLIRE